MRSLSLVLILWICLPAPSGAEALAPVGANAPSRPASRLIDRSLLDHLPGAGESSQVRELWARGLRQESRRRFDAAIAAYESIIPLVPTSSHPYWRIARSHWMAGDRLRESDATRRLERFALADDWARRGIEIEPECAECMLWRYAAMGRTIMTHGLISGIRYARTMSKMLDDGIALQPSFRDSEHNSTLGNLYYARAVWNRMVPEWFWLRWVVGVQGDKEQALDDIEHAIELSGGRIDYQVEKGAVLLCLGVDRGSEERVDQGREVLGRALDLEPMLESDGADMAFARLLLDQPEKACGYTRSGFIDVEGMKDQI